MSLRRFYPWMIGGIVAVFFLGIDIWFVLRLSSFQQTISSLRGGLVTSTISTVRVIPVEPKPPSTFYPLVFSDRQTSPVLSLVKRTPSARGEEVGQTIALTSDGWLGTSEKALAGNHLADVGVVWRGRIYPVMLGVRDTATGLVFLKTNITGLPSVAFVSADRISFGLPVWIESEPARIAPRSIIDVRLKRGDVLSSEFAARRFLLEGILSPVARGGAVWDATGQLVGVLEDHFTEGWRVIPASYFTSALSALLSSKEIQHAQLGVRSIDLRSSVFDLQEMPTLPVQGALVQEAKGPAFHRLLSGDVIEEIERDILDGSADLGERLLSYVPGSQVTISIRRAGQSLQVPVVLGTIVTGEKLK